MGPFVLNKSYEVSLGLSKVLFFYDRSGLNHILHSFLKKHTQIELLPLIDGEPTQTMRINPDLILLAVESDFQLAADFCKKLRLYRESESVPIVFVSLSECPPQVLNEFSFIADGAMSGPFRLDDLLMLIQSKIKRFSKVRGNDFFIESVGDIKVNGHELKLTVNSEEHPLTKKEADILRLLMQNKYSLISREDILRRIWKNVAVSSRTVDSHIKAIRKKLISSSHTIQTVYGVGYKLVERLHRRVDEDMTLPIR